MCVDIEFDPSKDALNRDKHGVSLAFGVEVFADEMALIIPSFRDVDGEERYKAIGNVDGRLWTTVYVIRGDICRLISVRKSNGTESRQYENSDPG